MVNRILGVLVVLGVVNRILGVFLVKVIVVICLVKAIFLLYANLQWTCHILNMSHFGQCHMFPSGLCFARNVDSFTFWQSSGARLVLFLAKVMSNFAKCLLILFS